jgi:chromosome partitioning protein
MEQKLVGISEIADMANVTRQAVTNWRVRYDDFPKPVQTLQSGPVWDEEVIGQWLKQKEGLAPVVISVINLKGGVAKTTTSVAVAEVLAKDFRKHVLLIDLDPQTNATINLIGEAEWEKRDNAGRTLAQLFRDALRPEEKGKFDVENSIVRGASKVDGGIARLDILPSSLQFIDIQEKLPFVAMQGNYDINPQEILRKAVAPVIDRYDYVIIDCPPSLGIVTKNGLRLSTHYLIPTIPDRSSTWGIFQIVASVGAFSESINHRIKPLGILATKVNGQNTLHTEVLQTLRDAKLFAKKDGGTKQPPLLKEWVYEATATARGVEYESNISTFKQKYGRNADVFVNITREIVEKCKQPKN